MIAAHCEAYTDVILDPTWCAPVGPEELAEGLARRDWTYRVRILQEIIVTALVLNPTPPEVGQQVANYATALGVGDTILNQIQKHGANSYDAAIIDFARNGYVGDFSSQHRPALHNSGRTSLIALRDRSAAPSSTSTNPAVSRFLGFPDLHLPCWPNTTGSMSLPTTAPPLRTRSKCSGSSLAQAIQAGSVGPWTPAGFSEYQRQHGDLTVIEQYPTS